MINLTLYGYSFKASLDKDRLMIGDKVQLTLTFDYDNLEEYEIEEPRFEDIPFTLKDEEEHQDTNGTWHMIQHYTLMAQKEGNFTLPALKAHIEMIPLSYQQRYNKNKYLKKFDIFSKQLHLRVDPLPQGLKITGDYRVEISVDKNKVDAGKPVHFTLSLEGEGNLKSLDFVTLDIPHTLIYAHPTHTLSKTFDILSEHNYTIPPIVLEYFNKKSHKREEIHTKFIPIIVHNVSSKYSHNNLVLTLFFLFLSILIFYAYITLDKLSFVDIKKHKIRQIKQAKDKKSLLFRVSPYIQTDKKLYRLVLKLEACQDKQTFKKIKKEILKHFYY